VALDWEPLFHLLRVTAVIALAGSTALVGWRSTAGHFPIRFGQIEYDAPSIDREVSDELIQLGQRICSLETVIRLTDDLETSTER